MADVDLEALIRRISDAVDREMIPFVVMIPIAPRMLRNMDRVDDYAARLAGRAMREEIEDWRKSNANTN